MARTTVRGTQIRDASIQIVDLQDFEVTAGTGLNINYQAGRIRNNNVVVNTVAGSLSMTDDVTNYVEVDTAGTVSVNVSSFTSGRIPLATVVTASTAISAIADKRTWLPGSLGTELTRKPYHGIESFGALSFSDGDKALTIASGSNKYWYKGTQYSTTGAIVCDLDLTADRDNTSGTLTANKLYYFYFKDATGKLYWSDNLWSFKDNVFVATIFWNGSAGACQKETHNHTRDVDWHVWAHDTIGTQYESGLDKTTPTIAVSNAIDIVTGTIHDEDLDFTTGRQQVMRGWRKINASTYTFDDYAFPYLGANADPKFVDIDEGAGYVLSSVPNSEYVVYWVYVSLDITRPIYVIPTTSNAAHNNIAAARLEVAPNLLNTGLNAEMKLIYKFIYRGDGLFQESVDYRSSSPVPGGGTSTMTAGSVSFVPTALVTASNVQTAIEEVAAANPGATGPQGPTGPQGTTGPAGATGPQGPTGTSMVITADPGSDHSSSGLKITLTAHDAQAFGDICFINADGEAALADASVIATSSAIIMCVSASVAADGLGTYLLQGIARHAVWSWTPGNLLYLTITGTTGNTISKTAPTGANEVIQIVGVATNLTRMFFNPSLVQVEHI